MVSFPQGWKIFAQALRASRGGSLSQAAEWMYKLNVFARSIRRHVIVDQIYDLKGELIQYLYQHGYSYEVKIHSQNRLCYGCNGTGEYWTGEDCHRCDGTGIYSVTPLYAFRFRVAGHSYAWHKPVKLVDYPVTLTDQKPGAFVEGLRRDEAILSMKDAWLGCCVVWWSLFLHGRWTELLLFPMTRLLIKLRLSEWTGIQLVRDVEDEIGE